jgi:predicted HD phosphohydrolase
VDLFMIFGLLGMGGLCYCLYILMSGGNSSGKAVNEPISVKEAQLITYKVFRQLDELHRLGKEQEYQQHLNSMAYEKKEESRMVAFRHHEISQFCWDRLRNKPLFTGQVLDVILDLLDVLDDHGDCPSVVSKHHDEPEKKYKGNGVYDELAKIPLYRHSLNTAEEAFHHGQIGQHGLVSPKLVIAMLSHDMGKIPEYYGRYYVSGTHSFGSAALIESIDSVRTLKFFEDIKRAVRNHHLQSADYFDQMVRECDQAARRKEINSMALAAIRGNQEPAASNQLPKTSSLELPDMASGVARQVIEASCESEKIATEITGDRIERQRGARKLVDISEWFRPEHFVDELSRIVNTRQRDELFWSALALGAYVYFKPQAFWQVIEAHSHGNCKVLAAAASEQDRDDIIYSVVRHLAKRDNVVAAEFLGETRFGALFFHNPHEAVDGKAPTKLFLIPFRIDAFANQGTFAKRKTTIMARTTRLEPAFPVSKSA